MVKIILIKSTDEWVTTKQVCRDELVVYLSFSFHNAVSYIYIYICFFALCFFFNLKKAEQPKRRALNSFKTVKSWPLR